MAVRRWHIVSSPIRPSVSVRGSQNRGGSTSVRGRVCSPHIFGSQRAYSLGSCAMGRTDRRTDRTIPKCLPWGGRMKRVSPTSAGAVAKYIQSPAAVSAYCSILLHRPPPDCHSYNDVNKYPNGLGRTRAMRCLMRTELYTDADAQLIVASVVNLVRPTVAMAVGLSRS